MKCIYHSPEDPLFVCGAKAEYFIAERGTLVAGECFCLDHYPFNVRMPRRVVHESVTDDPNRLFWLPGANSPMQHTLADACHGVTYWVVELPTIVVAIVIIGQTRAYVDEFGILDSKPVSMFDRAKDACKEHWIKYQKDYHA